MMHGQKKHQVKSLDVKWLQS